MPVERTCEITGKRFVVSDTEIELRAMFGVPLPTVHPTERMRELMVWRPQHLLFKYQCGLCKKEGLTGYPPTAKFPKYCKQCYYSDAWEPPLQEIDFSRLFFDQYRELVDRAPRLALSVTEPVENSDYCNAVTGVKNCYMCFNLGHSERCIYVQTALYNKDCVDTYAIGNSEIVYECMGGGFLYKTFWSRQVIKCTDSYFLYDCEDCMNCFMSTGLRHKQYVFRNDQLSRENYEKRIAEIDFGDYQTIQSLRSEYDEMRMFYPKSALIGIKNENVRGNYLYGCKDAYESYMLDASENCVNCYNLTDKTKDCLDVCAFGYGLERAYCSSAVGISAYNIQYGTIIVEGSRDCQYCIEMRGCSDCFGCVGLRKKQYCIMNKQYGKDEYEAFKLQLIDHMKEAGEYGKFFPKDMSPWGYNETVAQLAMPFSKHEAEERGFPWHERPVPTYSQQDAYIPLDNIKDISWDDLQGKVIVCEESARPFKIIKQEFDFYKKYSIPLPRLHPDVRLKHRYPTGELYNLHDAQCMQCGITVQTSMRNEDKILCEQCYQKAIY
ncbi:hypothetical protein HY732_05185 [Candidatus Uhrbacteria bacterium]|nr:hypothetical protein [Candidatus Uhrbacteria bacterium]